MPDFSRSIRTVIEKFGEIDWGSYSPIIKKEEDWKYPPVTVWRYKDKDEKRDQLIVDAVESFNGNIKWAISFRDRERLPGRNWSIAPKRFEEFLDEIKDNSDIFDVKGFFAATEPEVGKAANKELPELAEHIKRTVQAELAIPQI